MGAPTSLLIDQAAQRLGVSRRTVYYRIHEGRLETIRTRCGSQRVLVGSVEALLREGRVRKAKAWRVSAGGGPEPSVRLQTVFGADFARAPIDDSAVLP